MKGNLQTPFLLDKSAIQTHPQIEAQHTDVDYRNNGTF